MSREPVRIFLVDDSLVIRTSLAEALEELGPVQVIGTANSEASANAWLATNGSACDLVIVDILLDAGSGLGVLRFAQKLTRPVLVVVLTSGASADTHQRCLQLGARRVFDRATEFDELLEYCARLSSGDTGFGELSTT